MGSSSTLRGSCLWYLSTRIYSHQPFLRTIWSRSKVAATRTFHKGSSSPHGCNRLVVASTDESTAIVKCHPTQPANGPTTTEKTFRRFSHATQTTNRWNSSSTLPDSQGRTLRFIHGSMVRCLHSFVTNQTADILSASHIELLWDGSPHMPN